MVGSESTSGRLLRGSDRQLRAMLLSPFTKQRLRGLMSTPSAKDLDVLRGFIEDGTLTPFVDRKYPLKDAADALRHLRSGHATGKVVLTV